MAEQSKKARSHQAVMLPEVLELASRALRSAGEPLIVDATLGEAGHSAVLLRRFPRAALLCFDRDPEMLARATTFLQEDGISVRPFDRTPVPGEARTVRAPFSEAGPLLLAQGLSADFVLLDLGVSMHHFRGAGRGFSYSDELLDMRLDPDLERTAADLVNGLPESELAAIFFELGEERYSRRIARTICARRPIKSAKLLADVITAALPARSRGRSAGHPATRVFQALRIAVNDELGELDRSLEELPGRLAPGGLLAVISFHSLEDRAVKRAFRARALGEPDERGRRARTDFEAITRRPLVPGAQEVAENPAARTAKLRALARRAADTNGEGSHLR